MKYLTILLAVTLISCGYSTPVLNSSNVPFVVYKILPHNDSFAKYVSLSQGTSLFTLEDRETAIIAPKGLYNIGDTIQIKLK